MNDQRQIVPAVGVVGTGGRIEDAEWFDQAAAEAREASRKYWAPGGYADKKYPIQPMPWWQEPVAVTGTIAEDIRERQRRRRR
jgi:hypothetical protein